MSDPVPAPAPSHDLPGMGLKMPWLGAGGGALLAAGGDIALNGFKNWRRSLRKGLTGAAAGVGGELGLRLGGELARRHAVAGGGPAAVGLAPVVGALGGAGAGYFAARERGEDEDEA